MVCVSTPPPSLPPSLPPPLTPPITDGDGHPDVDASSLDPVFLGRAEYRVQSVDTLTGAQRWNVTYGEMLVMDPSK